MKEKKSSLIICLIFFGSYVLFAQKSVLNMKSPSEMIIDSSDDSDLFQNPVPYGYIDERDIMWSKVVWEIIDLDERINYPLYYPIDTVALDYSRRSLYDVLIKNIQNENLTDIYVDSYFTEKVKKEDLEARFQKIDTTDVGISALNQGETDIAQYIEKIQITSKEINQYRIKGMWYFDRRMGELKYRLLGIAPVAPDVNFLGKEDVDQDENSNALFWVWYPAVREILNNSYVFNPKNPSSPVSFDMLLNARRFNAVIYQEENEYGDRAIKDYIVKNSLFQLLESNRIKEAIRDKEQDMWSY